MYVIAESGSEEGVSGTEDPLDEVMYSYYLATMLRLFSKLRHATVTEASMVLIIHSRCNDIS